MTKKLFNVMAVVSNDLYGKFGRFDFLISTCSSFLNPDRKFVLQLQSTLN